MYNTIQTYTLNNFIQRSMIDNICLSIYEYSLLKWAKEKEFDAVL